MAEHRPPSANVENPELHHEVSDVNAWAVGKFAIALVLLSIVSLAGLFGLFRYLIAEEGGKVPVAARQYEIDARRRPPAPQLEETPELDLSRERAAEDKLLNSYAWIDQQSGTVRIPVSQAMQMLAQKGLPARTQAPQGISTATVPTESGLGEIVQQPGGPLAGGQK